MKKSEKSRRCSWVPSDKPDYIDYHDTQWGVPVHDDQKLFEMLSLEGAQAGLSWYTILKRRETYKKAFKDFDPQKVAQMTDKALEKLLEKSDIIRNRLKIYSVRKNAQVFLSIQKEFGTFDSYLWSFVGNKPIVHRFAKTTQIPTGIPESAELSKDLKKRGMSFVGGTIMYAYMQAVGLVDDHTRTCFRASRQA